MQLSKESLIAPVVLQLLLAVVALWVALSDVEQTPPPETLGSATGQPDPSQRDKPTQTSVARSNTVPAKQSAAQPVKREVSKPDAPQPADARADQLVAITQIPFAITIAGRVVSTNLVPVKGAQVEPFIGSANIDSSEMRLFLGYPEDAERCLAVTTLDPIAPVVSAQDGSFTMQISGKLARPDALAEIDPAELAYELGFAASKAGLSSERCYHVFALNEMERIDPPVNIPMLQRESSIEVNVTHDVDARPASENSDVVLHFLAGLLSPKERRENFAQIDFERDGERRATDAEGQVRFENLPTGFYLMQAIGSDEPNPAKPIPQEVLSDDPSEFGLAAIFQSGATEVVKLSLRESCNLIFRLTHPAEEVMAFLTDAPSSHVMLNLRSIVDRDSKQRGFVERAKDGRFIKPDLLAAHSFAVISAKDFAPLVIELPRMVAGEDTDLGELTLERGHTLRLRVVNSEGAAIAGAEIYPEPWSHSVGRRLEDELREGEVLATSDHEGWLELSGLPSLFQSFRVLADGYAIVRASYNLRSGETPEEKEIVLSPYAQVHGTLSGPGSLHNPESDGAPLIIFREFDDYYDIQDSSDLDKVRYFAYVAEADANGRYTFDDLPPGRYTPIAISSEKRVMRLQEMRFAPGESKQLDAHFGAGSKLFGRVTGPDGTPLSNAGLWLSPAPELRHNEEPSGVIRTDSSGAYEFTELAPGVWYVHLCAEAWMDGDHRLRNRRVKIADGGSAELNIVSQRVGAKLYGTALVRGAAMSLDINVHRANSARMDIDTEANEEGYYEILDLPPGEYMLTASDYAFSHQDTALTTARAFTIREGQRECELNIDVEYASLTVRITGAPEDFNFAGSQVWLELDLPEAFSGSSNLFDYIRFELDAQGKALIPAVAYGSYYLRFYNEDHYEIGKYFKHESSETVELPFGPNAGSMQVKINSLQGEAQDWHEGLHQRILNLTPLSGIALQTSGYYISLRGVKPGSELLEKGLAPGRYRVQVDSQRYEYAEREVEILSNETTTLTIDLAYASALKLTLSGQGLTHERLLNMWFTFSRDGGDEETWPDVEKAYRSSWISSKLEEADDGIFTLLLPLRSSGNYAITMHCEGFEDAVFSAQLIKSQLANQELTLTAPAESAD